MWQTRRYLMKATKNARTGRPIAQRFQRQEKL
jgi:hypothetical protein